MKKNKDFDCVEMTRKIRDALYKEHKDLNYNELAKELSNEAKKSELWNKIKQTRHKIVAIAK